MKKKLYIFIFTFFIFPVSIFAIPEYLIASGENIGIELKTNNPIIVGSYLINNYNVLNESNLRIGDKILKINDEPVTGVTSLQNIINKVNNNTINITYERNNEIYTTTINIILEDNIYHTGLYVKDTIRGVATLTYIDPSTNTYGALGHEIIEKTSKNIFDMDSGKIFSSTVTGITKSIDGTPGEKNARSDSTNIYGDVLENTKSGIFGNYTKEITNNSIYKVASPEEIKEGSAEILTTIEGNKIEKFKINILKLNNNSNTKNILFEVTDESLLETTGGIVQGMSGSPIIQNDKIIGAVNYVVVDKTNRGYGIFITNMLKESEN